MTRPAIKPRLATENGRRVGKTTKAQRLAAHPGAEIARLMRSFAQIRAEIEEAQRRSDEALKVLEAVFFAAGGSKPDPLIVRALAREALIECGYAMSFRGIHRTVEMAEEGTLCA
ncbi:hypothetical protein [Methylobacterium dankookense]|uniref:Uncharacterized protein n=1 Tax=Methylobacterium dankookense TaxID=560405 RepID=A0A564FTT7_9HYPH|nr:hypothetical protein [Methylobacterium dankookense]GJD58816.1 hypothetical protein IFDJLNFL_4741 [Methylobacterium dankookense]VUF11569.1 hypothetical protein MTDSW087_01252 [Methylobacterium dankookense]